MDLIVLTGIHTAGKSTVGEHLDEQGYRYDPEIAQQLIDAGRDGSVDGDDEFQQLVYAEEASRDRSREESAVVESWHIGNLAHAYQTADEATCRQQEEYLTAAIAGDAVDVYGLHLSIEPETIWERTDHFEEPDPEVEAFYAAIDDDIRSLYEDHGIPYAVIDAEDEPADSVTEAAAAYVEELL